MTEQEFLDRCKFQIESKNDLWPDDIRELVRIANSRPSRQKFDDSTEALEVDLDSVSEDYKMRIFAAIELLNRRLYGPRAA